MNNKYWIIKAPDIDYDISIAINGLLKHPFGIPGVECKKCDDAWGSHRVLDVKCPDEFIKIKEIKDNWPITVKKNKNLRCKVEKALKAKGIEYQLQPGDMFQPAFFSIPTIPKQRSFFWPITGGIVAPKEVVNAFNEMDISGVAFCELNIESVGNIDDLSFVSNLRHLNLDPIEIFKHIEAVENASRYGPFFEMVVKKDSGVPEEMVLEFECGHCGKKEYNKDDFKLRLKKDLIPDVDIFQIATTSIFVVNEKVKKLICDNGFSNIAFVKILID